MAIATNITNRIIDQSFMQLKNKEDSIDFLVKELGVKDNKKFVIEVIKENNLSVIKEAINLIQEAKCYEHLPKKESSASNEFKQNLDLIFKEHQELTKSKKIQPELYSSEMLKSYAKILLSDIGSELYRQVI